MQKRVDMYKGFINSNFCGLELKSTRDLVDFHWRFGGRGLGFDSSVVERDSTRITVPNNSDFKDVGRRLTRVLQILCNSAISLSCSIAL